MPDKPLPPLPKTSQRRVTPPKQKRLQGLWLAGFSGVLLLLGGGALVFVWQQQSVRTPLVRRPQPSAEFAASPSSHLIGDRSLTSQRSLTNAVKSAERPLKASARDLLVHPDTVVAKALIPLDGKTAARPIRMAVQGETLYFLSRGNLYQASLKGIAQPKTPFQTEALLPGAERRLPTGERIRELMDVTWVGHELVLLDKTNDLYAYNPVSRKWRFALKAQPEGKQPDPHYIALSGWDKKAYFLDYARNQIQRLQANQTRPYFAREVMSWERKAGDPDVVDAIDMHIDGDVFTLNRKGSIARFRQGKALGLLKTQLGSLPHTYRPPQPRALRGDAKSLYVVDAANRRIVQIDKATGSYLQQWILTGADPEWERLHDVAVYQGQLLALAGNQLLLLPGKPPTQTATLPVEPAPLDPRLQGWISPVPGALLPDNAGIFPGARRLYRYGLHEGADFFDRANPQQGGKWVKYGSPVVAVQSGKVVKVDHAFQEMSPQRYQEVLAACKAQHETSREHENLFRGRQVWLEHEGGITTVYAHLSAIPGQLQLGQSVKQGETIGYVGNSGTSNSLAGNQGSPHLHLEIWLQAPDDPIQGEYLGKWLSLAETRELWERVFAVPR